MAADRSDAAVGLWMVSRIVHILRLLCGVRDDPIADQPSIMPQFKQAFKRIDADCAPPMPSSIKPSILVIFNTWRTSGIVSDRKSNPIFDINSKADTASPTHRVSSPKDSRVGLGTVNRATPTPAGAAQVLAMTWMMPNVPSDPIKWRRS